MPETIVIEEIVTRLHHDLEKYGVRVRNIFRVCSLSFVYENINWVKWAHLCTRTCKSSWHGTSRAQFMRGFIYLHNISLFTYNLKNVAPNNKKVNLNSSICDRSLFFLQRQQNHSKACPGIQRNWKCLRPTLKAKTSCNDTSKGPLN